MKPLWFERLLIWAEAWLVWFMDILDVTCVLDDRKNKENEQ